MKRLIHAVNPVYDVPCRPHIGIMYWVNDKPRKVMVKTIVKPRTIPVCRDLDDPERLNPIPFNQAMDMAREWENLEQQAFRLDSSIIKYTEDLDDADASWELGRKYSTLCIAQEIHRASTTTHNPKELWKYTGRGQVPYFKYGPLIPKKQPEYLQFSEVYGFVVLARNLFQVIHKHLINVNLPDYQRLYSQRPDFYDRQANHVKICISRTA